MPHVFYGLQGPKNHVQEDKKNWREAVLDEGI
jgi:hypothetical protein